ncbi:MAG: OmpA family protein [Gammaproteobacteria bacterium]|nr:OmpA family protein [Gammaproteobacteria bacterium]MBU1603168.1 OmpA family protein [Gammaproteobacteria bacterium]MBU2432688.1 OmpA family protein [Gammaproteobacteria bacterium]MBU2451519.1 OmpA family protein [Gammaproteobacteria bacterium]
MNEFKASLALAALLMVGGCASERIVLLPSADGRASSVVVRDASGEVVLSQPYAGVKRSLNSNTPYQFAPEEVRERFAQVLSAQPPRPSTYVLYFESGSNVLTPESQTALTTLRKEIAERPASEVMVIGHTDRVGGVEDNDQLSKVRAEGLRDQLIEAGVQADKMEAVGRGERDPLVPTADEVDEPRNRRVEISVR